MPSLHKNPKSAIGRDELVNWQDLEEYIINHRPKYLRALHNKQDN